MRADRVPAPPHMSISGFPDERCIVTCVAGQDVRTEKNWYWKKTPTAAALLRARDYIFPGEGSCCVCIYEWRISEP